MVFFFYFYIINRKTLWGAHGRRRGGGGGGGGAGCRVELRAPARSGLVTQRVFGWNPSTTIGENFNLELRHLSGPELSLGSKCPK